MWFKNLTLFRLPKDYAITSSDLQSSLKKGSFNECGSGDMSSSGFVAPRDNDQLVHAIGRQFLLKFSTSKKLLPSSVINQATKARAAELEEHQGFAPGRKALKDLKERITEELLPRAFTVQTSSYAWIDAENGWLVIDSSSPTKCDDIIKALLKSIDTFPLESLRVNRSPAAAMTDWLVGDQAPKGFTIDQDADLTAHTENKAKVRYMRQTLDAEDVQRHIAAGKQCTSLALTWNDRISFVLSESLTLKKIRALDSLDEKADSRASNEQERFDADFILMTSEIVKMLDDILFALGGELEQITFSRKDGEIVVASNLIAIDIPVKRDEFGYWTNPEIPDFDEDHKAYAEWLKSEGLELAHRRLDEEDETHPSYIKVFEEENPDVSEWNPKPPQGEGWCTFSIHETEDGSVWVWARRIIAA